MKPEDIYHAVTDLRDDQVLEGEKKLKYRRSRRMILLGAIAAALAVVVLAGALAWPKLFSKGRRTPAGAVVLMSDDTGKPTDASKPADPPDPTGDTTHTPTDPKLYNLAAPTLPQMVPYPTEEVMSNQGWDAYMAAQDAWKQSRAALKPERGYADGLAPFLAATVPVFLDGTEGKNRIYSPVNVYLAMAMLTETAGGSTRQELLELLGESGIEDLRARANAVWRACYSDDGMLTSLLANSVWLRDDWKYREETLTRLAEDYYAWACAGTMGDPAYNEAIHRWIDERTGGLLQQQAAGVNTTEDTALLLLSTIWYKASWGGGFNADRTARRIFHSPAGDESLLFMHQTMHEHTVCFAENFTSVGKELNGAGQMFFLLPEEGVSPEALLQDPDALAFLCSAEGRRAAEQRLYDVHFSVPKFDVSSDIDLYEGLKALGVTSAFEPGGADFSPLTEDGIELYVSEARHDARVRIDEEGCEAAAFTVIETVPTSAEPQKLEELDFILDRPFLFVITNSDGLPLFIGIVNHPAE